MANPGASVLYVLLAALAAGTWWLNQGVSRGPRDAAETRSAPDGFYMLEAEITTAGVDGLPRYRVIADEIRQAALGGPTELHQVRVEYNIYSPTPWLLTAPTGMLAADQSLLELWGGVEITSESSDHGRASVETERLDVYPETHIARTDAPVELKLGPQRISAHGMVAHLLEERLQLDSRVHGRFLP